MAELHENQDLGRYEMVEQGQTVFADVRRDGPRLYIDHVESPEALRGSGAAGRLMEAVAGRAKQDGLTLVPLCSYAAAWLSRNPQ